MRRGILFPGVCRAMRRGILFAGFAPVILHPLPGNRP